MSKLFGTDGVRGVANQELTPELAFKLGVAGAYVLSKHTDTAPNILIGNDSRISSDMLEAALTAGMCSVGANVYIVGVVPTPAIAYLVRENKMTAGVMISASHNKVHDNGIKFFNEKGLKLSDEIEKEIEDIIADDFDSIPRKIGLEIGRKYTLNDGGNKYIEFLKNTVNGINFSGLTVAIDCANGATSHVAEKVLTSLGAEVKKINANPDGTNINANSGSTHIKVLSAFAKENKVDLGFAFDGDGDRVLAVDRNGEIVDGDQILAILGTHLKDKNNLKNNTIVATVMSNLGLILFGKENEIHIATTAVGDRYVLEYMLENNCNIGGEQSGHIILT
ncbi:MAG: phosphoglucosamine mutase, partial [Lachnospirales bacterium]